MAYEWIVPAAYVAVVAVKTLVPPHPHSKVLQLCLAEAKACECLFHLPPVPETAPPLKAHEFMFMEERKLVGPACQPPPVSVAPHDPLEVYG